MLLDGELFVIDGKYRLHFIARLLCYSHPSHPYFNLNRWYNLSSTHHGTILTPLAIKLLELNSAEAMTLYALILQQLTLEDQTAILEILNGYTPEVVKSFKSRNTAQLSAQI